MAIDKKSSIDLTSRLSKVQARKLLAQFIKLEPSTISFSGHAFDEMEDDYLIVGDIINVFKHGKIHRDPEFENGSWRYRIETGNILVVFIFRTPNKIKVITAWRK